MRMYKNEHFDRSRIAKISTDTDADQKQSHDTQTQALRNIIQCNLHYPEPSGQEICFFFKQVKIWISENYNTISIWLGKFFLFNAHQTSYENLIA